VLLCGGAISPETNWRSGARIGAAVNQVRSCQGACLLISSGVPGHGEPSDRPEAHRYFEAIRESYPDLPAEQVLVEDLSRDTVGNVYFSLGILRVLVAPGIQVDWVTNAFHLDRVLAIVRWLDPGQFFEHCGVAVPDCVPDAVLAKLCWDELSSLRRFERDACASSSPEELLFLHHDFYRADRLSRRDE
jgi:hypothetical protein